MINDIINSRRRINLKSKIYSLKLKIYVRTR